MEPPTPREGVQAVSRDKDPTNSIGNWWHFCWFIFPVSRGGVVYVLNCCLLKFREHGTNDLQVGFHCKHWFSLIKASRKPQY